MLGRRSDNLVSERVTALHTLEPVVAGVPRYVARLVSEQRSLGMRAFVLLNDRTADWPTELEPFTQRIAWSRTLRSTIAASKAIASHANALSADVVHAHSTWAGVASRVSGARAKIIYQPHGWGFHSDGSAIASARTRVSENLLSFRAARILTLSREEEAAAPMLTRGRLTRVGPLSPTLPSTDRVDRRTLRHQLGLDPMSRLAIVVGEVSRRKQQVELAHRWVARSTANARLMVVGNGEDELFASLGVDQTGWVANPNDYICAADLVIVSSRGEGFSLVIEEAVRAGTPVATLRIGGSELVEEAGGILSDSLNDLVDASLSFLACPHQPDVTASTHALERLCNPSRIVAAIGSAYQAALT